VALNSCEADLGDSGRRIQALTEKLEAERGDPVRVTTVIYREGLDQAGLLEFGQAAIEGAWAQLYSSESSDVLDERVPVLRTASQAGQDQNALLGEAAARRHRSEARSRVQPRMIDVIDLSLIYLISIHRISCRSKLEIYLAEQLNEQLGGEGRGAGVLTRTTWTRLGAICCGLSVSVWGLTALSGASAVSASPAVSALLSPASSLPNIINLPTGPQASAASCPNPPDLSGPLPTGASISPPSLVPAGLASVTVGIQTYDLGGTCEYTVTLPSASSVSSVSPDTISITYLSSGLDLYLATGLANAIDFSYGGRQCDTSAEIVTAYGYAIAEQKLTSGNCTSNVYDPSGAWGHSQAIDTALQSAPLVQEPTFSTWYESYEAGTVFYGQFQECMESPVGQQSSYVCSWNNYGPLF
jgi:hypothetical protein